MKELLAITCIWLNADEVTPIAIVAATAPDRKPLCKTLHIVLQIMTNHHRNINNEF